MRICDRYSWFMDMIVVVNWWRSVPLVILWRNSCWTKYTYGYVYNIRLVVSGRILQYMMRYIYVVRTYISFIAIMHNVYNMYLLIQRTHYLHSLIPVSCPCCVISHRNGSCLHLLEDSHGDSYGRTMEQDSGQCSFEHTSNPFVPICLDHGIGEALVS